MLENLINKKLVSVLALGFGVSCQSNKLNVQEEGLDISHHQKNIDWNLCTPQATGKKFIIAKATEGETFQDPKFVQNWGEMSSDFRHGAYHFVRYGSKSTPEAQMDNFIRQLDKTEGWKNGIIALDIEERNGTPAEAYQTVGNVTETCVTYLKDHANVTPYIYTRTSFWNPYVKNTPEIVQECPLWIARYRLKEPSPEELPNGWKKWTIWQYSQDSDGKDYKEDKRERVPGISGPVDRNKMRSEESDG